MSVKKKLKVKKVICKNCENKFRGKYCSNCGQFIYDFDKPFKFLIVDFLGNMLSFDTRFWNSLKSLISKPGKNTEEYTSGKRVKFMPPFRFYIFVSFIFFLMLSIFLKKNVIVSDDIKAKFNSSVISVNDDIQEEFNESENKEIILNEKINDSINLNKSDLKSELKNNDKLKKTVSQVLDNPSLYINSILKYISWSLFFLMPIYAFFLWLFFRKSKQYYYTHFINAINQHILIFIILFTYLSIKLIFPNKDSQYENILLFIIPIYMTICNYNLYKQKIFKSIYKSFFSLMFYIFIIVISLSLISVFWVKNEFAV